MHPTRRHFLLAGLFCLFVLLLPSAHAGDYRYPRVMSALVITVPAGWQIAEQDGPAQLTTWSTPQDENYLVTLMSLPADTTPASRDAALAKAAQVGASAAGLTDVKVSAVTEERFNQGIRTFATVHASGKHDGTAVTFVYAAFQPAAGGHYYVLGEAGPDASLLAHKEDFQSMANSIQPVSSTP